MTRREAFEAALAEWRDAERRLDNAVDGEREGIALDVERHRAAFQQLSAEQMSQRMDTLREADTAPRRTVEVESALGI